MDTGVDRSVMGRARLNGDITRSQEWAELDKHHGELAGRHLRELFADDPGRAGRMTLTAGDLYLDYAKHRVTGETVELLVRLAERAGLRERIEAMFTGEHINVSEDRAVLHTALRAPAGRSEEHTSELQSRENLVCRLLLERKT